MDANTNLIDMHNEELTPIEPLSPFKQMVLSVGTLPSAFYNTMTYYESLVYFYEYLKNEVIPTVNNNGEAVTELQEKYIELKSYIDNYFENLDVQEEINNKLDEMTEDGSLTNLIKDYVDPIYQAYEETITGRVDDQDDEIENFEEIITARVDDQDDAIDNFEDSVNSQIAIIDAKVDNANSGSPLVASSTAGMTDTTRVYVNTTDGNWYYYDGDSWEIGGVYQASQIANNTITANMYKKINIVSNNKLDPFTVKNGYISSSGVINEGGTSSSGLNIYSDFIKIEDTNIYVYPFHNICFYDSAKSFISGTSGMDGTNHEAPASTEYIRISAKSSDIASLQVNFQNRKAPYDKFTFTIDQTVTDKDLYFKDEKLIQNHIAGFKNIGVNLFNKNDVVNGVLGSATGYLNETSTYYSDPVTSDFIEVDANSNYSKGIYGTHFTQCYYNNAKEFISGALDANISTPANCKYIRVSVDREYLDTISIIKNASLNSIAPFLYSFDGLREEKYNNETSFFNPITEDSITFENLIKCRTQDSKIEVEVDSNNYKEYLTLNEDLSAVSNVRDIYIFKTNKKVLNLDVDCKTAGDKDCIVSIKFYNKAQEQIYLDIDNSSLYPLNNENWEHKNFRFLIPEEAHYTRLSFIARTGSSLYIRDISVNLTNKAIMNSNTNLLGFCGHQGMNLLAPKNTIPSFEYAIAGGMNECVINVNWTSDNEIVCLHDDTIDATSDGTGNIHEMTYATALTYDFGSWFSTYYTGTKIPKLEEVLKLFAKSGMKPVIRWNDGANSTIETKIFDLLKKYGFKDNVTIIGFTLNTLASLKVAHPEYKYGFCGYDALDQTKCENILNALGENAIVDYAGLPDTSTVKLAHDNGLIIGCWFVNNISNLYTAIANGVDYVKTDLYCLQNCNF